MTLFLIKKVNKLTIQLFFNKYMVENINFLLIILIKYK